MGRPFVAPPGVPADRLAALRAAFDATLADPAFLEDAKKQNLNVVPVSAREMTEVVSKAYATPPAVVQRTIRALGRGSRIYFPRPCSSRCSAIFMRSRTSCGAFSRPTMMS